MKPAVRKKRKTSKGQMNIRVPVDLAEFIREYADREKTTVTQIIVDHFKSIREKSIHVPQC